MSKNSAAVQSAIDAFVAAQVRFVGASLSALDAESARVAAFTESAIAASLARSARVTLQKLADSNKSATLELAENAPKGTLYVSLASVTVHAFTGDILRLPVLDGEDVTPVAPISLQSLVSKVYKAKGAGTATLKSVIGSSKTQQGALESLTLALAAAQDVTEDVTGGGSDDDGEDFGETEGSAQTVETLLSRVLAMVADGAEVSDAARAMVDTLAGSILSALPIAA